MSMKLIPTNREYSYKGYKCAIYEPPDLGENFRILFKEALDHAKQKGKKEIIFLEMSDIRTPHISDFTYCDKSIEGSYVVIANSGRIFPFYIAHEIVHLLPKFYDIDNWVVLRVGGYPIENWPLLKRCIRQAEHLLSDIHIDKEVIKRGFSISEHFHSQLMLSLPVYEYSGEHVFDFFDRFRMALNYLIFKYQLDHSNIKNDIDTSLISEFNQIDAIMRAKWKISLSIAYLIDELIVKENYLQEFDKQKFSNIINKTMLILKMFNVPCPF